MATLSIETKLEIKIEVKVELSTEPVDVEARRRIVIERLLQSAESQITTMNQRWTFLDDSVRQELVSIYVLVNGLGKWGTILLGSVGVVR